MEQTCTLIVGAGPTGLALAIELARRSVPFRLVDRNPAPLPWDRATVIKPRTLEIMDTLGLADAFISCGQTITHVDLYDAGARVASIAFDGLDSSFPFMLAQPQSETERILIDELERLGGHVERDVTLEGLTQRDDAVLARVGRNGSEQTIAAQWLVGTDGLRSVVREAVGDPFEGHDNPMLWGVVDATIDGWKHSDHHIAAQLDKPSANPIPLADGRWRMYFRPETQSVDEVARVEAGLAEMSPGAAIASHDEPRFFHTHSRVAAKYQVGRVLLAGDAAHACSPIQGHGLNSGVQDAHNLGWKLALAESGAAADGLLDTYEVERRPVAQMIIESGEKAEAAFMRQDPEERRKLVAELATQAGNRRASEGEAEIYHSYEASPIVVGANQESIRRRSLGCAVADVSDLMTVEGPTRLYELLRSPGIHVFVFEEGGSQASSDDLASAAAGALGSNGQVWRVTADRAKAAPGRVADPASKLKQRFGGGQPLALALVRPDGYLALADSSGETSTLRALLGAIVR